MKVPFGRMTSFILGAVLMVSAVAGVSQADAAREIYARRQARRDYLSYLRQVWWMQEPLKVGIHTRMISERITQAVDDYLEGKSTFLLIQVPVRHGKSDMCSRGLPGYFLGRCADRDPDVILSGYGADLVRKFSRRAKAIIGSSQYRRIFPKVRISREKRTDALWQIERNDPSVGAWTQCMGEVNVTGLGGALTGSGGSLLVLDDYCKSRAEAESETFREKTWDSFANDFMTRRAPVSIVIIVATPWHTDDVAGRLQKRMAEDPAFPRFEILRFPAKGSATANGETIRYKGDYLFTERFSNAWYEEQYATLGPYSAAGLMDCNPVQLSGNLFRAEIGQNVIVHDSLGNPDDPEDKHAFPNTRYVRFWDLASTTKERIKDDPDWTVGTLLGVTVDAGMPRVWIKHIVYGQWEAPERNRKIVETAKQDGPGVRVAVESVGGYKDTWATLREILKGVAYVEKVTVSSDKVVRAAPLEPVFDAGNVHILRGPWLNPWLNQVLGFPLGSHDDFVDSMSGAYNMLYKKPERVVEEVALNLMSR